MLESEKFEGLSFKKGNTNALKTQNKVGTEDGEEDRITDEDFFMLR